VGQIDWLTYQTKGKNMKKLFAILALSLTGSAFAGSGVSFEFERERGNDSPNTFENTFSVAPYYKFDNGIKADIKFYGSREDGSKTLENKVEVRVQKMYDIANDLKAGARISIGEKYTSTGDYSYYTIEPKVGYTLTNALSLQASYRYRNAFNTANNYETGTTKLGFDYNVTKQDEVGVRYFMKRGDSDTNGVELAYTRSF
jgi:hypothetical protein